MLVLCSLASMLFPAVPARAQTTIYTYAGSGTMGYSGDGGSATSAQLTFPMGICFDAGGNLYIADFHNHRIRKVTPAGIISTVAGNGIGGYGGDGGAATSAQLRYPYGVAADSGGNLYIADSDNNRIRKVSADGKVTTVAGTGPGGYSGDGGPATSALLYLPTGVAIDGSGNLYVAEMYGRVRKISTSGIITTIAGTGTAGYSGDGGPATSAQLGQISGLFLDGAGNIYLPEFSNHRVRRVSAAGTITTVAGNGVAGFAGDGGPAIAARLNAPSGVAADGAGNIYIADSENHRVRKVSSTGAISTIAGNGYQNYSGYGGVPTETAIGNPFGLVFSSAGELYISDIYNGLVRVLRAGVPVSISIPTSSPLPQGTVGVAYSQTLSASGGSAPYAWSVVSGNLPAGIRLSGTGTLSGTPNAAGSSGFTVEAKDSSRASVAKYFALTIGSSSVTPNAPAIARGGIVNAASNAAGQPVSPGSLVSVYGSNLSGTTRQASSIPLPTSLDDVSVTFNDIPAPLVFVAPSQVNAQVPWDVLPAGAQTGDVPVVVKRGGTASAPVTVTVGPFSPGIFALNYGTGNAIAINPDGSLAAPAGSIAGSAPAKAGDASGLVLLATGLGPLDSYPASGNNSMDKTRKAVTSPEVLVGGAPATVLFAGASPQFVGVNQINIVVPDGARTGDAVSLQLRTGGITTTDKVTIAVAKCCNPLTVTPSDALKAAGLAGQLTPSAYTITYSVQNSSGVTVPYVLASSASWLSVSRSGGTLAPGQRDTFTMSLNANVNTLAAGSYSATVTLTEKVFGTSVTRTATLDISGGACVNIAGQWIASERGSLRCTVTVNGESDTETDPISGSDLITINQQDCQVSYTSASIMSAFGSSPTLRQGQVKGTNVTFSGIMGQMAGGFSYEKNVFEATGTVQGNTINLTGSGTLIASGVWQGMNTRFSCTATSTTTMTKWK